MKKEVEKYNETQFKSKKRSKYNVRMVPVGCILRNSFGTGIKNKQTNKQANKQRWVDGWVGRWMDGGGGREERKEAAREGGREGGRERRKILMSSFLYWL